MYPDMYPDMYLVATEKLKRHPGPVPVSTCGRTFGGRPTPEPANRVEGSEGICFLCVQRSHPRSARQKHVNPKNQQRVENKADISAE